MVAAALKRKTCEEPVNKRTKRETQTTKIIKENVSKAQSSRRSQLKEIEPINLRRERGAESIGGGTFG